MGALALSIVAATVLGCKKEENSRELAASQIDVNLPSMREEGHWEHVVVPGKRLYDVNHNIYCEGSSGKCLEYYIYVKDIPAQRNVFENEGYLFLPSTTGEEQEIYPTDVWLHIFNLKHDLESGIVNFKIIE